jgi:hypothetical protein
MIKQIEDKLKGKDKAIAVQAVEALRVARGWGSHIFRHGQEPRDNQQPARKWNTYEKTNILGNVIHKHFPSEDEFFKPVKGVAVVPPLLDMISEIFQQAIENKIGSHILNKRVIL